jgi:enamine deaminase RidA (YjgF/YER057c/UK114 family)
MSRTILQPDGWARPRGYANGIAAEGRQVFVSGQIGWDATQRFVSDEFAAQARQALSNIVGCSLCRRNRSTSCVSPGSSPAAMSTTPRSRESARLSRVDRQPRDVVVIVAGSSTRAVEIEATAVI